MRERKRSAPRRSIQLAALTLVSERKPDEVTIHEIGRAADITNIVLDALERLLIEASQARVQERHLVQGRRPTLCASDTRSSSRRAHLILDYDIKLCPASS